MSKTASQPSISIHSPRMGRDRARSCSIVPFTYFNPLSPHGERLCATRCSATALPFQSTLPAWGETYGAGESTDGLPISIHSPRMGRDEKLVGSIKARNGISIHSPRMGRDGHRKADDSADDISIHSPRMGRDAYPPLTGSVYIRISIHSPRMGRDLSIPATFLRLFDFNPLSPHGERPSQISGKLPEPSFQSTLPAWGETAAAFPGIKAMKYFNPLSPHGERRTFRFPSCTPCPDFNPLSPHGERLVLIFPCASVLQRFQSTLPAWGETLTYTALHVAMKFQSTLPAWGETGITRPSFPWPTFQSTLPAWGETGDLEIQVYPQGFQSTLPAWGETAFSA